MARYKRVKGGEKNELSGKPFTMEELDKIGDLYIELKGKGIHENNPKIHYLAEQLGRTIRSVENQLLGFRAAETNKTGRKNYNRLIPRILKEKKSLVRLKEKNNKIKRLEKEKRKVNDFEFRISAQLKDRLGKELITDDYIAIFELVKNSFDADAKKIKVFFEEDKIIIWDDGKGMVTRKNVMQVQKA